MVSIALEGASDAFSRASQFFPTPLQLTQFEDKYPRFNYQIGRRETWIETVDRSVNYLRELARNSFPDLLFEQIRSSILKMEVMPSMRLLAMAGPAARRNPISIYNCSFVGIDAIDAFVEALYISMSGCGVGFSVERQFIENLPPVTCQKYVAPYRYPIPDSAEGWAEALNFGLESWFMGYDIEFDYSNIRPAGAPLRIKGGQASGPVPLYDLLTFARRTILAAQGRQLRPIEVHDILCNIGQAAVSGGVRRTAMISLFDFDDREMMHCKTGGFPQYRWNANNSAVWPENLSREMLDSQMDAMFASNRGEPGIFNRPGMAQHIPDRRKRAVFGVNPCGEVILRNNQFCNLSAAVCRSDDTYESLKEKVKIATLIGTIQSAATNFPNVLRLQWKRNCEEERLLGVDLTGQMDSLAAQDPSFQERLREVAIQTNQSAARVLGINKSAAITCVKPSGNTSTLVDCSPGIHPRFARYYIRRIRLSANSPVYKVLRDCGVPLSPENGQTPENAITWVASFPVASPENAITSQEIAALDQCEYWKQVKLRWCEHNPSVTIKYRPEEQELLKDWIWENREIIGGISFSPLTGAEYDQMPYEKITEEEYDRLASELPIIDFSRLTKFERLDETTSAQEIACTAGGCEL